MTPISSIADYFFSPYEPRKLVNGDLQPRLRLITDKEKLFSSENLEKIIEKIDFDSTEHNGKNLSGLVGEMLANQILEENIGERVQRHLHARGKSIRIEGRSGFTINSSQRYIAKLNGGNRIYILKKQDENNSEGEKFGFENIAEIDGLYMVKILREEEKNSRTFYAIESKVGHTNIDKEHIVNDLIIPLKEMYQSPINYVMIGFPRFMYKDTKKKIFSNSIKEIYEHLNKNSIRFIPLVFPFSENKFGRLMDEIKTKRTGWTNLKCGAYNIETGEMKILMPNGEIMKGQFISE